VNARAIAAIGGAAVVALLAACAAPGQPVPDDLRVPFGQALLLEARATGVQIYECRASKDDPARFEWAFIAPEAELSDAAGRKIGRHYAGPTWESSDGSKVVGAVKAQHDAPDTDAIPWLLLSAKSNSGGGILGRTASIQRVGTTGGKAPAGGCSRAQAGQEARIAYRATYYFYALPEDRFDMNRGGGGGGGGY
jgi:hypothetical protein